MGKNRWGYIYQMGVQITMISYIIKFLFRIICWKNETSLNSKESFYTTYISKTELLWCFKLHSKAQWTKLDSQSGSFFYSLEKPVLFSHSMDFEKVAKTLQFTCSLFKDETIEKFIYFLKFCLKYFSSQNPHDSTISNLK